MAVQLPPNSTGTTLDTATVAGKDRQRVVVADPSAANDAGVTSGGALKVDGSAVTQPVSGTLSVNALPAGSSIIGKVGVDQTTPGTTNLVASRTNAYRNGGTLHRNARTAADKLALPGTLTLSAITEGGSTLANTAYFAAVSAYNRWGPTGPGVIPSSITPSANQAVRIAFSAVSGADGYDIFLSTASSPLWVTRITESQRAAGGIVSSVGGYAAGGAANSIDIGIVGTGVACNVAPFATNNAYTPASLQGGDTFVNCAGYSLARALVKLAVADLRSLPALTLVPFFANQVSTSDYHAGQPVILSPLSGTGYALEQDFRIPVDGSTGLGILIDSLAGQTPSVSVWIELA